MFGTKTTAAKLQVNSDKIVNVFTKTVTDLQAVNAQAEATIAENDAEIKRLQEEATALEQVKAKNETLISKLNNLFA